MLLEMNVNMRRGNFNLATTLSVNDVSTGVFGTSGATAIKLRCNMLFLNKKQSNGAVKVRFALKK
jgi:hypothetical protein